MDSTSDERTLTNEERLAVQIVKDYGQMMLEVIDRYVHPSREASLAKTKVEECVMWAVKGITG